MERLFRRLRFIKSRALHKGLLAATVTILLGSIHQVNPRDLDPLQLGDLFGIVVTGTRYDPGDRAALSALLLAVLLIDKVFGESIDPTDSSIFKWLDRILNAVAVAVAFSAGWNWLLQETGNNPGPHLIAVANPAIALVALLLLGILIPLVYFYGGDLARMLWRRLRAGAGNLWRGFTTWIGGSALWRWLRDRTRRK